MRRASARIRITAMMNAPNDVFRSGAPKHSASCMSRIRVRRAYLAPNTGAPAPTPFTLARRHHRRHEREPALWRSF
jgi:hypothetical protein